MQGGGGSIKTAHNPIRWTYFTPPKKLQNASGLCLWTIEPPCPDDIWLVIYYEDQYRHLVGALIALAAVFFSKLDAQGALDKPEPQKWEYLWVNVMYSQRGTQGNVMIDELEYGAPIESPYSNSTKNSKRKVWVLWPAQTSTSHTFPVRYY